MSGPPGWATRHVDGLRAALDALDPGLARVEAWGDHLATRLTAGGRLLVAGNGGSAAHAQHLTAELVGRYRTERRPFSALALHADTSTLTALANDYGAEAVFGRQVEAHGRPGDVLIALSTSGRSPNLLEAVAAARTVGMATWALTGAAPNPLSAAADQSVTVPSTDTAVIQEVHQVLVHLVCEAVDRALGVDVGVEAAAIVGGRR